MTSKPKYRSGLEENFANKAPMFDFEPYKVPYTVERKYIPDFVYKTEAGHDVLIECKGYFRVGDTQKYKAIKRCLVFDELVFLLSDPKKRLRKGAPFLSLFLGSESRKTNSSNTRHRLIALYF